MNPERASSISKISGGTVEQKREAEKNFTDKFSSEQSLPDYYEREKTDEEKELIQSIVGKLNAFLLQYGATPLNISHDNIQLLDRDRMNEIDKARFDKKHGFYKQSTQKVGLVVSQDTTRIQFAVALIHELIHFVSFNGIKSDVSQGFSRHRVGLSVDGGDHFTSDYFEELNEALTEELMIRFYPVLKDIPSLESDYANVLNMREKFSDPNISSVKIEEKPDHFEVQLKNFVYKDVRQALNKLVDIIYEKNSARFSTREDAFSMFAKAAMTGEIRELAQTIESTLGAGSLKKIAISLTKFMSGLKTESNP